MSMPAICLSSSPARCEAVPMPNEAMVTLRDWTWRNQSAREPFWWGTTDVQPHLGEFVIVAVGIVKEASFLNDQPRVLLSACRSDRKPTRFCRLRQADEK